MRDLKQIASGRGWDIPDDQLERISPVLQSLDTQLREVLKQIPEAPSSAIRFTLEDSK
jgi:hypothetical protein